MGHKYDMAVRPDYELLNNFRSKAAGNTASTSRGITAPRKFCLALTRDVIERAIERIEEKKSCDPYPKRQPTRRSKPSWPPTSQSKGQPRGRPLVRNKLQILHDKARATFATPGCPTEQAGTKE